MRKEKQNQKIMNISRRMVFFFFLFLCLGLNACSAIKGTASYAYDTTKEVVAPRYGRMDFDLSEGIRFYKQAGIYLGEIYTQVHPNINLEKKPTALFVPMGLVQENRDHEAISQGVSRIIWQNFLAESTFATLEYAELGIPYSLEHALPYAEQKGAEYLVGGLIQQYYDGGANGDSRFAVQLQVYHVASGSLMWSINHSGVLPYKNDGDFATFRIKNRMPVNPMSTLVSAVGSELAILLHYWTEPKLMQAKDRQKERESFKGRLFPSAF